MNGKEIGIYVALTHSAAPESYRITDDGTKIYVIVDGGLVYFEGKGLDEMGGAELYNWTQQKIREWRQSQYW